MRELFLKYFEVLSHRQNSDYGFSGAASKVVKLSNKVDLAMHRTELS
jgi:hypothetical protein